MTAPTDPTAPTDLGTWGRRRAERLEDLTFMADHGETHTGAATRLNIDLETLDRWCHRHNPDIWHRLVANSHRTGHLRSGSITQRVN